MAATRKGAAAEVAPEKVGVKGSNGLVFRFPKGVAEALLKNKADYTRAEVAEPETGKGDGSKYPEGQEPAEGWTVAQLTAWAGDNDVEVPAGPKPAVVEAVMSALAERKAESGPQG